MNRKVVWVVGLMLFVAAGFGIWHAIRPNPDGGRKAIRVIYFSGLPEGELIREELPRFTAENGIEVKFEEVPYDAVRPKAIASLKATKGVYDVMFVDDIWLYEFVRNKYVHPLDDLIRRDEVDMDDFFPLVRKAEAELDGKTWLIPQRADVQVLFYRTDHFADPARRQRFKERYGEDLKVPDTWDEYRQVAEFLAEEGKGASPPFFGCAETLKRPHFAFEFFAMRYWAVSNRNFLDEEGRAVFDTPETVAAMNLLTEVRPFAAPGSANASHDETVTTFGSGKAALALQWYAFYPTFRDAKMAVHDKFGVALVPGVRTTEGEVRRAPSVGGGSLGIASNSTKKEEAWRFIKHMTSKEFMERAAVRGAIVTRQSAYQNADVEKNNPTIPVYLQSLQQCWLRPRTDRFVELESAVGLAVSQAFVGELPSDEAIRQAAKQIETFGK
jgi:multiple sugar transport system substrate-binding protein